MHERLVFTGRLSFTIRAQIAPQRLACALALMLFAAGCAHHRTARLPAPPARIGSTETGIASWYGVPYDGRPTASGEVFDMEKLTAAHRDLPFQTWVEVTNLSNGKQVNVRITDRGPFVHGRVIDLSMAAAREIDMVRAGVVRVRLKVIAPPVNALEDPPPAGSYAVQAGVFSDPARAEAYRAALPYADTRVVARPGSPSVWRVLVGHALTLQGATALSSRVDKAVGPAFGIKTIVVKEVAKE